MSSDTDVCLKLLDDWIKARKDTVYDENVKSPDNQQSVLSDYTGILNELANKLLGAIEQENFDELKSLGWPESLLECIKHMNIRDDICDRIEQWFIRFPYVHSRLHLNELEKENLGVNQQ